jgi:hypothetical protein
MAKAADAIRLLPVLMKVIGFVVDEVVPWNVIVREP